MVKHTQQYIYFGNITETKVMSPYDSKEDRKKKKEEMSERSLPM